MSATQDGWIKMSERKPTEAEARHGIFLWRPDDIPAQPSLVFSTSCENYYEGDRTHWMSAVGKLPAPPARELSLAEKDQCALDSWMQSAPWVGVSDAWRSAIVYERAEIAKLLIDGDANGATWRDTCLKIEARVKGTQ